MVADQAGQVVALRVALPVPVLALLVLLLDGRHAPGPGGQGRSRSRPSRCFQTALPREKDAARAASPFCRSNSRSFGITHGGYLNAHYRYLNYTPHARLHPS